MPSRLCGDEPDRSEHANDDGLSIFDDERLKGWHTVPEESAYDWSIRNVAIVGHESAEPVGQSCLGDRKLTDFELTLQYRLPDKGNTGIEIHAQPDLTDKRPFEGYHANLGHVGIGHHILDILGAWYFYFATRREYPCPHGTRLVIDEDGEPHSSKIDAALTVAELKPDEPKGQMVHTLHGVCAIERMPTAQYSPAHEADGLWFRDTVVRSVPFRIVVFRGLSASNDKCREPVQSQGFLSWT